MIKTAKNKDNMPQALAKKKLDKLDNLSKDTLRLVEDASKPGGNKDDWLQDLAKKKLERAISALAKATSDLTKADSDLAKVTSPWVPIALPPPASLKDIKDLKALSDIIKRNWRCALYNEWVEKQKAIKKLLLLSNIVKASEAVYKCLRVTPIPEISDWGDPRARNNAIAKNIALKKPTVDAMNAYSAQVYKNSEAAWLLKKANKTAAMAAKRCEQAAIKPIIETARMIAFMELRSRLPTVIVSIVLGFAGKPHNIR